MLRALVLHLHPKAVPERALRFSSTFGLGGMALVLVLLLVGTGVLLLMSYEPSVEGAYESVAALRYDVPMGQFLRNLHRWGANLALVLVVLHLLRVVFTGALHGPRRGNWIVGLVLLVLVAGSNFTGYLLPWDQVSYWAVTISTGMLDYVPLAGGLLQRALRGGEEVGRRTLATFFVLHVVVVPVVLVALLAVHFWLVRKAKGVVIPGAAADAAGRGPLVPTSPNLTRREGAVALALLAALAVAALVVDAPLAGPANPGLSPNPAKAPWYFMGLQELLIHFHPFFVVVVLPLLASWGLVRAAKGAASRAEGVWFASPGGRRVVAAAALAAAALTVVAVALDELLPDLLPPGLVFGFAPFLLAAGAAWGTIRLVRTWFGSRMPAGEAARDAAREAAGKAAEEAADEASMAWFGAAAASYATLTVIGVFFRGAGMALTWPW